ncbi:MAG: rod shape-determining protein MreC [Planctomycetota bacterium]
MRSPRALRTFAVWAAILLGLLLLPAGLTGRRGVLGLPFRPLQSLLAPAGTSLQEFSMGEEGLPPAVEDRFRRLEAAVADQRIANAALHAEIRRLGEIRETFGAPPERILLANVAAVASDANPLRRSILLAAGTESGVRPGQPALWGRSLAGVVAEASPRSSRIRLLTDAGVRIRARSLRAGRPVSEGVEGLLEGTGGPQLMLRFVPMDADVRKNDVLVSAAPFSGLPAGAVLARVFSSQPDPASPHLRILAEPVAPFGRMDRLAILRLPLP